MRTTFTILTLVSALYCDAQEFYEAKLTSKLNEIRKLNSFDNGVVVLTEEMNSDLPRWGSLANYYEDDLVTLDGGLIYRAVLDSKGKDPSSSPNEWRLVQGRHPYLFLRDTAKTEDLKALLSSDYPYIRIYAFGALAYRKYVGLFQIVIDNLNDTTRIQQYTGDYGYDVCPADLMLWYTVDQFSSEQKDILKKLILTKYIHLNTLEKVLLFHKPTIDSYSFVRAIVSKGSTGKFGLIALSRYCKHEDFELIRTGFSLEIDDVYYRGYKVFFKAIENFPDKSLEADLIQYKGQEMHADQETDEYYVRALASYKDNDCLNVLKELARQDRKYKYRTFRNRVTIYKALKKHYSPIYDGLMKEIMDNLNKEDLELNLNRIEENPWNY